MVSHAFETPSTAMLIVSRLCAVHPQHGCEAAGEPAGDEGAEGSAAGDGAGEGDDGFGLMGERANEAQPGSIGPMFPIGPMRPMG